MRLTRQRVGRAMAAAALVLFCMPCSGSLAGATNGERSDAVQDGQGAASNTITAVIPGEVISALVKPKIAGVTFYSRGNNERKRVVGEDFTCSDGELTIRYEGCFAEADIVVDECHVEAEYIKRRPRNDKRRDVDVYFRDIHATVRANMCLPVTLVGEPTVTVGSVGADGDGILEFFDGKVASKAKPIFIREVTKFLTTDAAAILQSLQGDRVPVECDVIAEMCRQIGDVVDANADAVLMEINDAITGVGVDLVGQRYAALRSVSNLETFGCTVKGTAEVAVGDDESDRVTTASAILTSSATTDEERNSACLNGFRLSSVSGAFPAFARGRVLAALNAELAQRTVCLPDGSVPTSTTFTTTTSTLPADMCAQAAAGVARDPHTYVLALRKATGPIELVIGTRRPLGPRHDAIFTALSVDANCNATVVVLIRAARIRMAPQVVARANVSAAATRFDAATGELCLGGFTVASIEPRPGHLTIGSFKGGVLEGLRLALASSLADQIVCLRP